MLRQPAFGNRLKKLRTARGLSQTALAGEGMSTGYLSRLESGARQPTDRAVAYLADRLGLKAADFEEPVTGSLAHALTLASSTGSADAIEALRSALAAEGHESAVLRWQALWLLARAARPAGRPRRGARPPRPTRRARRRGGPGRAAGARPDPAGALPAFTR